MLKLIAITVITVMMSVTTPANASVLRLPHKPFAHMTRSEKVKYLKRQIRHDHSIIRFWTNHRTLAAYSEIGGKQIRWAQASLRIASKNLKKLTVVASHVISGSDMSAWLCIHSHEGAWNDPGSPYWGGLQMDMGFQSTYGSEFLRRWGTADHWPVWAQITAARRARDGYAGYGPRGYGPWPNTARECGLL